METKRILVLDRNSESATKVSGILCSEGYQVEAAHNWKSVIEVSDVFRPHAILIDPMFLKNGSTGLLSSLKKNHPNTLVIVLLKESEYRERDAYFDENIDDIILKPISPEGLSLGIERGLEVLDLFREKGILEARLRKSEANLEGVNQRLQSMVASSEELSVCDQVESYGPVLLREFSKNMAAEGGSLFLCHEDRLEFVHSLDRDDVPASIPFPLKEDSVFGLALREKRPVTVSDINAESEIAGNGWEGYKDGSAIVFPLIDNSDDVVALISLHNKRTPPFTKQDLDIGIVLASMSCRILNERRLKNMLNESNEKYEFLFENNQAVNVILNREANIVDINEAGAEKLGYAKSELVNQNVFQFIFPEQHSEISEVLKQNFMGIETPAMDINVNTKTGIRTLMFESGHSNIMEEGDISRIFTSAIDVTERKNAEEALRKSEERYRSLFESIDDSMIVYNEEGRILDCNAAACLRLGYTRTELLEMNVRDIDSPEFAGTFKKRLELQLTSERICFEGEHLTKDGYRIPVDINSSHIQRPDGPAILSVIRDISRIKRIEAEKMAIEKQYHQSRKMEAIGKLAGGIAHDFNNILQVIQGYNELCILDSPQNNPMLEKLSEISKASEKAASLVRQILDFSKNHIWKQEDVNVNAIISDSMDIIKKIIGEHIRIENRFEENIGMINANQCRIEQVITNLCVNSRDAMPDGGTIIIGTDEVYIDDQRCRLYPNISEGKYVCLSISDTGIGMSSEIKDHIFEPFFTTKSMGQGTGLGLATVYAIVDQHDGFIEVDSEPDQGTMIKVYIPVSNSLQTSIVNNN